MSYKPNPDKNINLTINGQSVTVPEGTTILEAAKKVNIRIPTLCDHSDLCRRAICRICVVECDGGSKLIAACANDVWEGVNVVTNNSRILDVRKTILELILANHPQDCLSCARNKKCALQSLAGSFGIRAVPFERSVAEHPPVIESETIVRDMAKCVKCASCAEACQAIGAINTSGRSKEFEIRTPYGQALEESPCVFCGQCAAVCPVGAIYEHDQTAQVWAALVSGKPVIAQVSPALSAALDGEFGRSLVSDHAAGTITSGKMIAAIKLLGFNKVYDARITTDFYTSLICYEIQTRIKSGDQFEKSKLESKLPVISGCSEGVSRFVKHFYPDLESHLFSGKTPRRIFAEGIKSVFAIANKQDIADITSVSFVPCIAQKYGSIEMDFAITAAGLARMIKLAGIDIFSIPEQTCDHINLEMAETDKTEPVIIRGFAEARKVMETIRKGECEAKWIEILSYSDNLMS